MGNIFDTAARVAFNTTTAVMGYDAEWHKKDETVVMARVHVKDPDTETDLGDKKYVPRDVMIEYMRGDFDGLKELADANKAETIKINLWGTVYDFYTVKGKKVFDGQTVKVNLMRKTEEE